MLKKFTLFGLFRQLITIASCIPQIYSREGTWKTLYVSEIITQGAKTPSQNPFYLDFYKEIGPDTLLPNGERQQYILGNQVQILYSYLLDESSGYKNVRIFSASDDASQQSASAHMLGIFPDDENNLMDDGFEVLKDPPYEPLNVERLDQENPLPHKFRPYAMKVQTENQDFYFLENLMKICPKKFHAYKRMGPFGHIKGVMSQGSLKNFKKSEITHFRTLKIKDMNFILLKLRKWLKHIKFYGKEINEIREHHLELLYDTLQAHYHHNGKHMNKFDQTAYDYLSKAYGLILLSRNLDSSEITKAYNTYKLRDIVSMFSQKLAHPESEDKYTLFSGDEVNMMALLKAFNKTSYSCLMNRLRHSQLNETATCREPPAPASSMIFELLQNTVTSENYVRVIYNGLEIKICGNGTQVFCKWETWKNEILKNYVLKYFFNTCGNDKLDVIEEDKLRIEVESAVTGSKIIAWILALEIFMLGCVCYGKSRSIEHIAEKLLVEELAAFEKESLKNQGERNTEQN